jgi:hypothetical protein
MKKGACGTQELILLWKGLYQEIYVQFYVDYDVTVTFPRDSLKLPGKPNHESLGSPGDTLQKCPFTLGFCMLNFLITECLRYGCCYCTNKPLAIQQQSAISSRLSSFSHSNVTHHIDNSSSH